MTLRGISVVRYGQRMLLLCWLFSACAGASELNARKLLFDAVVGDSYSALLTSSAARFKWRGERLKTRDIQAIAAVHYGLPGLIKSKAAAARVAEAEYWFEQGNWPRAIQALSSASGRSDELKAYKQYLNGVIAVQQGDLAKAASKYNKWKGRSLLRAYLAINIGIARAERNQFEQAQRWLKNAASGEFPHSEEWASLKDRAYAISGSIYNMQGQPALAKRSLKKIRLDGLEANKALVGLGWADVVRNRSREALAPWGYLSQQNQSDIRVQEAYLLMPFALGHMKDYSKAVARLSRAVEVYDQEIQHLSGAIARAEKNQLLTGVENAYSRSDADGVEALNLGLGKAVATYTIKAVHDDKIYKIYQSYMDLLNMLHRLENWKRAGINIDVGNLPRIKAQAQQLKAAYAKQLNDVLSQYYQQQIDRLIEYKKHANFSQAKNFELIANQEGL